MADLVTDRGGRSTVGLPPTLPLPAVLQTFAFWRDPHRYLALCDRRYGERFTVRAMGMAPLVFLSRSSDIREVVGAPADVLHPGAGAAAIMPLVGRGSFMLSEGDDHLRGRRAVLPAFQRREVEAHRTEIRDIARSEITNWPLDEPVALHPYLRALSLRVILRTVIGRDDPVANVLHREILAMLNITGSLALQEAPLRRIPPWSEGWRRFSRARGAVDELLSHVVAGALVARSTTLLERLVSAASTDGCVDVSQVKADLMSVIVAGHETTASELAWTFQLLAHHRHELGHVLEDVDGGSGDYIEAMIYEVLRHRPVFLFTIPRVVRAPVAIGEHAYEPDSQLVGCVHLMHHNPDYFPAPQSFRPERFMHDAPPGHLWMPWGGGRKRCPGLHLALNEMRAVVAAFASQLTIEPAGRQIETARWRSVIVTPEHGCRVTLRRRTRPTVSSLGRICSSGAR